MTDHSFNPGANNSNGKPEAPQSSAAQATQAQRQATLADLLSPSAVSNRGGEAPKLLSETLVRIIEQRLGKRLANNLYVVVIEDQKLKIPAVAVYAVDGSVIYAYPMLIEAAGARLEPFTETGPNGVPIVVDMPTSRYFDVTMQAIAQQTILADAQSRNLCRNGEVRFIASVVIHSPVKLDSDDAIAPFVDSARAAVDAQVLLMAGAGTSPLQASMLADKGLQLAASHNITPGASDRDVFGTICAQDFRIDLKARPANRNQNNLHNVDGDIVVSALRGYVDFAYHEPDQMQKQMARMPGNMNNIPGYDPYIVITSMSPLGAATSTMDNLTTQLLALASISGIAGQQRWGSVFTRAGSDKKTSIGALALEHDPNFIQPANPQILPVSAGLAPVMGSDQFSPLEVIQKWCHNTMVIALDIEQGGPMSWVQSIFAGAQPGSWAEAHIHKELNLFSNGIWDKIWDRRNPIIMPQQVEVHLGHYSDSDGSVRDVRTLDYLHMLAASKADAGVMIPYTEGFTPGRCDRLAMHKKREIIKAYASNVEFTGIATRVFFNTAFINALEQLLAACGLRITLEGLVDITGFGGRTSAFDGSYAGAITTHGAFQQSFGGAANYVPTNHFSGFGLSARR